MLGLHCTALHTKGGSLGGTKKDCQNQGRGYGCCGTYVVQHDAVRVLLVLSLLHSLLQGVDPRDREGNQKDTLERGLGCSLDCTLPSHSRASAGTATPTVATITTNYSRGHRCLSIWQYNEQQQEQQPS